MEPITVTADEFFDGTIGVCLACGTTQDGHEPDARQDPCEVCDAREVYGIEEAVLMGAVDVVED